jgi:DNA-binding MarR family transcriptional regulator
VGELADLVLLNQPTLSKALDRLETDGIVERFREAGDRRSVSVRLGPRGRTLAKELVPLANAHEHEAFAHLGVAEKRALVDMLQRTIERNR